MSSVGAIYSGDLAEYQSTDAVRALADSSVAGSVTVACLGHLRSLRPTHGSPNLSVLLSTIIPRFVHLHYMRVHLHEGYSQDQQGDTRIPPELPSTDTSIESKCRFLYVSGAKMLSISALLKHMPALVELSLHRTQDDDWPGRPRAEVPHLPKLQRLQLLQPSDTSGGMILEAVVRACVNTLRRLSIPANTPNIATLLSTANSNQITDLVLDFHPRGRFNTRKEEIVVISCEIIRACSRLRHLALMSVRAGAGLGRLLGAVQHPLASLDVLYSPTVLLDMILVPLVTAIQDIDGNPHYALARLQVLAVNMQGGPDTKLKLACANRRICLIQYQGFGPLLPQDPPKYISAGNTCPGSNRFSTSIFESKTELLHCKS